MKRFVKSLLLFLLLASLSSVSAGAEALIQVNEDWDPKTADEVREMMSRVDYIVFNNTTMDRLLFQGDMVLRQLAGNREVHSH